MYRGKSRFKNLKILKYKNETIKINMCPKNKKKLPLIIVTSSGGARMQEGAYSLMQLAKTSSKLARFSKNGGFYIVLIADPTTGGISASIAMLGDVILAEPNALICFAGPRVIKQTIGQDLPEGFQKSEFLLKKGFIDDIVHRKDLNVQIGSLLSILLKKNSDVNSEILNETSDNTEPFTKTAS